MSGEETSRERVQTGIRGLDTILRGGFFQGSVYLVQANPGSGKTILGNQICFNHVAKGGRAVFVTLLTESHSKLLAQLENLAFFDASVIGDKLTYVTAYQALEKDKLKGLLVLLRKIVRDHDATMLVIDHDMPLLTSLCDRLVALELGQVIAEGAPAAVLDDERVVESYLGVAG